MPIVYWRRFRYALSMKDRTLTYETELNYNNQKLWIHVIFELLPYCNDFNDPFPEVKIKRIRAYKFECAEGEDDVVEVTDGLEDAVDMELCDYLQTGF